MNQLKRFFFSIRVLFIFFFVFAADDDGSLFRGAKTVMQGTKSKTIGTVQCSLYVCMQWNKA